MFPETFLFSCTIRENLTFGGRTQARKRCLKPPKPLIFEPSLKSFRRLRTVVGERGVTLSGGQKQRAAIARLCCAGRDPYSRRRLASVDTYTEERILGGLSSYTSASTTILISHRVSTVRNADQIAVLIAAGSSRLDGTTNCWPRRLLCRPLSETATGRRTHCRRLNRRPDASVTHSNLNHRGFEPYSSLSKPVLPPLAMASPALEQG